MDSLDIKILRGLLHGGGEIVFQPNFRTPFRKMARELGVNEGTLRNRVRGLEESGFVEKWWVRVNPRLLGVGDAGFWFDVPDTKSPDDVIDGLLLIPGMDLIVRFYPRMVTGILRYTDERALHKHMEFLHKTFEAQHMGYGYIVYPECSLRLTKTDWAILRAVKDGPRKPYPVIAKQAGYSVKTVRRRLRRLIEGCAAFAFAELNVKALQGAVMASLMVVCTKGQEQVLTAKIAANLDSYLAHMMQLSPVDPGGAVTCVFNLIIPNVAEGSEILTEVGGLGGVMEARLDYYERIIMPRRVSLESSKASRDADSNTPQG